MGGKTYKTKIYIFFIRNSKAFYKCSKLNKVVFQGTKLNSVKSSAFKNINKQAVIKVPAKKYTSYNKILKKSTVGTPKSVKIKD